MRVEILVASIGMFDQAANLRKMAAPTRVVTFASSSVGVGYTTCLANIAVELALNAEWKILIFEARGDYPLNNRSTFEQILGTSKAKSENSRELIKFRSTRYEKLDFFSVSEHLSMAKRTDLEMRLKGSIKQYDLVLLDLGHVNEYSDRFPAVSSPELVVITASSKQNRSECYAMIKNAVEVMEQVELKLIVNMSQNNGQEQDSTGGGMKNAVKQFLNRELDLLGDIPLTASMISATRHHRPVVESKTDSVTTTAIKKIAHNLQEKHSQNKMALAKLGSLLAKQFDNINP